MSGGWSPVGYRHLHPARLKYPERRAITLCEAVAIVEDVPLTRCRELAQRPETLTGVVARWRLGEACTPSQWRELTALCLSRGPVVHRFTVPWIPEDHPQ